MQQEIQDLARLKAAHDLAVQEYGQGWEGILTLRLGRQNDTALRRHIVSYFKRCLCSSKAKLPLHRSVYIHNHNNDVHAHCYVSHKWAPNRSISDAEIEAMKDAWLMWGELKDISDAKRHAYRDLYAHYKPITHYGAEHGNFGSYGFKEGRDTDYLYEAMDLRYKDLTAHSRGLSYMKQYGHTTHYQNIAAAGW